MCHKLEIQHTNKLTFVHSPIIYFHVLPIKKENSGGDVTDIEVSCVNWRFIHIDDID